MLNLILISWNSILQSIGLNLNSGAVGKSSSVILAGLHINILYMETVQGTPATR